MATWKDRVKQTVSTGGTGAIVVSTAVAGYQALGAADDGKVFPYGIEDGTAWETGYGVYTHSGTSFARTQRDDSSTGSALNVTTAATFFVDLTAARARSADNGARSLLPGGRLTLSSGLPVLTVDASGVTVVFYTPYVSDVITLWDGNLWVATTFAETSLALGTLTSGKNYDVFAYLSGGVLALELLAWTSDTVRATTVTIQDGRYCKNGDKTRLWLGSFRTTSTTTTEDSQAKRFVFNAYNRVARHLFYTDTTSSRTYALTAWRQARGQTASRVEVLAGLDGLAISLIAQCVNSIVTNGLQVAIGYDSTTAMATNAQGSGGAAGATFTIYSTAMSMFNDKVTAGYHAFNWLERASAGGATGTFYGASVDTNGGNGGGYTNGIGGQWAC